MARILYSRTVTITLKMSFFEALYGHDRHLVISIVEMLDWRDFSSLLEADKGLARLMKDENITEINKIICQTPDFYRQKPNWLEFLMMFTKKSHEEFQVIKPYFLDFGSLYSHEDGRTPLHSAMLTNNSGKAKMLLDKLPTDIINEQEPLERNDSILHFAVNQDLPAMVEVLLNDPRVDTTLEDEDENTAYMCALYRGNVEIHGLFYEASKARTDIDVEVSAKMDRSFFSVCAGSGGYENDGYFEPSYPFF